MNRQEHNGGGKENRIIENGWMNKQKLEGWKNDGWMS